MMGSILKFASVPLFLVVIMAGYSVLWFTGAERMEAEARAWISARQDDGWAIEHGGLQTRGFPMKIRVELADVKASAPPHLGGWTARADAWRLEAPAWGANNPVLRPIGPLALDLGGLGRWQVDGGRLEAVLDTAVQGNAQAATLAGISLTLKDLRAVPATSLDKAGRARGDAPALTLESLTAQAERLDVSGPVDVKTATHALTIDGHGLTLPPGMATPLGRDWQSLEVSTRVLGPLPPAERLLSALQAWRDDGGVLEVDRLYVMWAPLEINIAGTLALDDRSQPVGALSSHVRGFFQAIERLEDAGIVRARDATMARVVLGSMAHNASQGGSNGSVLSLPVTVQDRKLSMGPVALFDLPTIRWGSRNVETPLVPEIRPGFEIDRDGNILRRD